MALLSSQKLLLFSFFFAAVRCQQCYFGRDQPGDLRATNCSTLEWGEPSPCCFEGHFCLEQNACWDPISTVTYQYGCTDSTYEHPNCPKKCDFDTTKSSWVGLVSQDCDNNSTDWICNHPDSCGDVCPDDRPTPWPAPPFAVPSANCGDLSPSVLAASGVAQLTGFGSALPTASTVVVSTNEDKSKPSGLSSQAKLGIGLGVGIGGGALLIAVIVAFLYFRRHKQRNMHNNVDSAGPAPPYPGPMAQQPTEQYKYNTDSKATGFDPTTQPGYKAELPGSTFVGSPRSELYVEPVTHVSHPGSPVPYNNGIAGYSSPPVEMPGSDYIGQHHRH